VAPKPIPAPRASGFTSTTGVPLYWCAYGESGARRLLVLHGGPGAHHDYLLPQMLELTRVGGTHELLFYDQRGGGKSRGDSGDHVTWKSQVQDLGAVITEFGMSNPIIVGYSWGALLAMLYAGEAAVDTSMPQPGALVLIDPAPISRQYRQSFESEFARRQASPEVERMRAELAASGLRERDMAAYRQRNFELSVAGYFEHPSSAKDLTPFRVTARVQQSVWESLGNFDLAADGRLAAINTPALIVHGRQDPIPLASSMEASRIMKAELAVLEHCGHVPYVEQPQALFSAIDGYIRRLTN
jgi:proline iminopeptidase